MLFHARCISLGTAGELHVAVSRLRVCVMLHRDRYAVGTLLVYCLVFRLDIADVLLNIMYEYSSSV